MFYWGAGTLFSPSDPYGGYLLVLAILLGLILIFTFKRGNETWKSYIKSSDIKGSIWMIVFLVFTLVILYLGSYQLNVLPIPYDWITMVIGSAIIYVIALKTALPIETIRKTVIELLENPEGSD
jgi:ABC-type transport system involved in cytochrome c biogenesis permease subunit